jgi:uncharacterized protein YecT (DUF1311 family)
MRVGFATAFILFAVAMLAAGCGSSAKKNATTPAAPPKPQVIRENFTPLPCPRHPSSTLDMEGCAEQSTLRTDKGINAQVATIFTLLIPSARPGFVRSERSWRVYRNSSCEAESSKYAGGTAAVVEYGYCVADLNRGHLHDLVQFRKFLQVH